MKLIKTTLFLSALTLIFATLNTHESRAQLNEKFKITEAEEAAFAFNKLSGKLPNYDAMIARIKTYKNASSEKARQKIYEENSIRLQIGWQHYNLKRDYLSIKTDIIMQLREDTEEPTLNFKFVNSQDLIVPYFPYPFEKDWIAVVAKNLENFTSLTLTDQQYTDFKKTFKPMELYKGKLNLELRPISTDSKKPLTIDGIDHWLMMADIAHLAFIYRNPSTGKNNNLGSYKADWHQEAEPSSQ